MRVGVPLKKMANYVLNVGNILPFSIMPLGDGVRGPPYLWMVPYNNKHIFVKCSRRMFSARIQQYI